MITNAVFFYTLYKKFSDYINYLIPTLEEFDCDEQTEASIFLSNLQSYMDGGK